MLIPIPQKSRIRLISRIQIPKDFKGKGYENDLLTIACEIADKQDFILYFQITNKVVKTWLKIHKFKVTSDPDLMYRLPANNPEQRSEEEILEVKKYLDGDD
jgi:hypothetical protein